MHIKNLLCVLIVFTLLFPTNVIASDVIVFKDGHLELAIRNIINKPEGDIFKSDVESITELDLQNYAISDISGLEHFSNLTKLDLSYNYVITDIAALGSLSNLKELYLAHNNIRDISALRELMNLTHLDLSDNEIYSIRELPVLSYSSLNLTGNYLTINENNEDMIKIQEIINCGGNVVYQYQKRPYTAKVTDFTDGKVSVNLVKHDDNNIPCKLIIAAYSLNNRLLDTVIVPVDIDGPKEVDYTKDIQNHVGGIIKTFIWSDQADIEPLSVVAEKELFEVAVVDYITEERNENNDVYHKLHAFANSERIELAAIDDKILSNIQNGDVIKYSVNQNGDIDQVILLYNLSDPVEGIYERGREIIACGTVDVRAGRVSINVSGGESKTFVLGNSEMEVYVYDTNQGINNIQVGSIGDLSWYDYAFIRAVGLAIKEVVVIK